MLGFPLLFSKEEEEEEEAVAWFPHGATNFSRGKKEGKVMKELRYLAEGNGGREGGRRDLIGKRNWVYLYAVFLCIGLTYFPPTASRLHARET